MNPKSFDEAFTEVRKLVENFKTNPEYYLSRDYGESDVRKDFIDRLFLSLGYDMYHEEQTNPYEREVRIEKSVRVEGRGKRADYAFYIAPDFSQVKFICEAKKPLHNLENKDFCFQTLRYGWNSNTPLAILTDFDRFFILDSRYKPSIKTALDRIHKKYTFEDFTDEEKFREIYFLFSREAVADGSIEKYAAGMPKAGGKRKAKQFRSQQIEPVDEEFLSELDEYREELARAFKRRNEDLDGEALTEITQRTLDRLVFIRFLEDKLVEPSEIIDRLGKKTGSAWRDFIAESERLNKIYNGIIFKPHEILDRAEFAPDEKTFEMIRDWLSSKYSPYDFNTIPIHILGSIYERFLGKTIVATDKRARVEEKPEVRKAGGVYYTPEYIVRYIVENTVGKMIEGKKPEEIAEMHFADIACGSGSFLLGVFDELIAYHARWFDENKTRRERAIKNKQARETAEGNLQLSLGFKRDILLNNIYGVDLDAQAVEVAQLSLYLKLLEEETTATAQQHLAGFREQLLPSLGKNIVHGNSLIDFDIMDGMLFDTKDLKKLNPMNFEQTFPEVFKKGGFDAIVGNPPYGAKLSAIERKYLANEYKTGTTDTAALMLIQAKKLCNQEARIGLIVPKSFTYSSTWGKCRKQLIDNLNILTDVGKVWKKVKLEQVICFFEKKEKPSLKYESFKRNEEEFEFLAIIEKINTKIFGFYLNGLTAEEINLGIKINDIDSYLGDVVNNSRGGMFQSQVVNSKTETKVIGGKQISQFFIKGQKGFIENISGLSENSFVTSGDIVVQNIVAHLMNPIDHIKIIGAIIDENIASEIVILDTVNCLKNNSKMASEYILAVLHSKLINWYVYRFIFAKAIRTMHFDSPVTNKLPIPIINFNDEEKKLIHDSIVSLVSKLKENILLYKSSITDKDKTLYHRYSKTIELQIDEKVYELFNITPKEKKLIESL